MKQLTENPYFVAVGGMLALITAMGIGRFVYTPILPFMVTELGLSKADAGLIASANFLGYLVGALAAASSRLPGSQLSWFFSALAVSATSTMVMAIPDGIIAFLAWRFIGGVASAFVLVFSSVLILDRLETLGKPALSAVHFAGVGCGIALSAILVSSASIGENHWRDLWLVSGAAAVICALLAFWLVPKERVVARSGDTPLKSEADPRLKYFIVAYGLFGFGYVITATFISDLVRNSDSLQPIEPYIWLAVGIGAIPSVWFWTAVGRRWGNDLSFAIALVVEAVSVALSVLSDIPVLIVVAALLLGATFMGITALGLINARLLSRGDPRRMLALMTAAFGFGQMIGPSFAGYIFDISASYLAPSIIASAALVAAAALAIRTRRQ